MVYVCKQLTMAGMAVALVAGGLGCGFEDDANVACRCTEQTDFVAFPHCSNVTVEGDREGGNPFSTRIPDCPSGTLLFLRENTEPEAVLLNVRDAIEGFSPIQYLDQVAEDFLFVPDADGVQLYREVFNAPDDYDADGSTDTLWTRQQEAQFIRNILDKTRFQSIEFQRWYDSTRDERKLYENDPLRETYIFQYRVEFTEQPSAERRAQIFGITGRMEVDVQTTSEDNPLWIISRWQDLRDAASARQSWTELRGEFSQ